MRRLTMSRVCLFASWAMVGMAAHTHCAGEYPSSLGWSLTAIAYAIIGAAYHRLEG